MKTTVEESNKAVRFMDLAIGDMFRDPSANVIAMRCKPIATGISARNSVIILNQANNTLLQTGDYSRWEDHELVLPVNEVVFKL